jgi:glycosyltransferase involved in cell wall biosynthesis
LERSTLARSCFWCSCSRYTTDMTAQVFRLRPVSPHVIYNPVPISGAANPWSPTRVKVVVTGTLAAKKGVIQLTRVWPEVVRAIPDARLHIYGRDGKSPAGGSMREHLIAMLPGSARESVVFHGVVSHSSIVEVLRSAQVAMFPSHSEAFGMAPMESMSQGCPTAIRSAPAGRS